MWFYVSEPYYVSQALGKEESQKPKLHMDTIFIISRQFLDPLFGCRKPEGRLVLEELWYERYERAGPIRNGLSFI